MQQLKMKSVLFLISLFFILVSCTTAFSFFREKPSDAKDVAVIPEKFGESVVTNLRRVSADPIKDVAGGITDNFKEANDKLASGMKDAVGSVVEAGENISSNAREVAENVKNGIASVVPEPVEAVAKRIKEAVDSIKGPVYFYDDDNKPQFANCSLTNLKDLISFDTIGDVIADFLPLDGDVLFYLYTRSNRDNPVKLDVRNISSIRTAHFNNRHPTKIVIHGFTNSYKSPFGQTIKDAYLNTTEANVIVVDWSVLAKAPWYVSSMKNTRKAGIYTAKLIYLLVKEKQLQLQSLHVVGHSLGAHVSGITGKHVSKTEKIGRITGLDPALPLYILMPDYYTLNKTDAKSVDIIHTAGGLLGQIKPLGHLDFYPNGGTSPQPDCGVDFVATCSHSKSWQYFAESINGKILPAEQCDNLDDAISEKCNQNTRGVRELFVPMGEYAFRSMPRHLITGIFHAKTDSNSSHEKTDV